MDAAVSSHPVEGEHRERKITMNTYQPENKVPIWRKYTLTIEEAAAYFRIGEGKIRYLVHENPNADYILWNGNRALIKRILFEKAVDKMNVI